MHRKPALIASAAIVFAMTLMSLWAWTQLPPGSRVPVHWAANGSPDRFADKVQALAQLPIVALVLSSFFAVVPRFISGRLSQLSLLGIGEESLSTILMGIWMACLLAIGGNHSATVLIAAGGTATQVVQAEIGLLFVILGGYHLGQVSRTSLLGVRTPWTLTSDLAWDRCQRVAGSILVTMGIATVALALLGDSRLLVGSVAVAAGLFVITVMTYSYRVAKLDGGRQPAQ